MNWTGRWYVRTQPHGQAVEFCATSRFLKFPASTRKPMNVFRKETCPDNAGHVEIKSGECVNLRGPHRTQEFADLRL